ncbi:MAG TPA: hypothetical protein VEU30_11815, partial [Thermoanaerobaculia bacterium]|nr:hypothetical protein [Thermoanaerobaculia bacterium]
FAVDSVPAIFAITREPLLVFTSNVCAILGLRAMYFLLAGVIDKFHFLNIGLALVLMFVGIKMVIVDWYKVPISVSLIAIAGLLGASIAASMIWPKHVEIESHGESLEEIAKDPDPGEHKA